MQVSRRGFLGMLAAATTTAYFFAPVGGWKSDLIINPNDLPAPTIHKANAVYGRYNWLNNANDPNSVDIRPYPTGRRVWNTLPPWTSGTAHLISV